MAVKHRGTAKPFVISLLLHVLAVLAFVCAAPAFFKPQPVFEPQKIIEVELGEWVSGRENSNILAKDTVAATEQTQFVEGFSKFAGDSVAQQVPSVSNGSASGEYEQTGNEMQAADVAGGAKTAAASRSSMPSRASGGENRKPVIIANPAPEYPSQARRQGWEGVVRAKVLITTSGTVEEVIVSQSSGYGALDRAAMDALYRWRFSPAVENGQIVAAWANVPVAFRLQ